MKLSFLKSKYNQTLIGEIKTMTKVIKHKLDIHQEITDAVVEALEEIKKRFGDNRQMEWNKPWIDTLSGSPKNVDGKAYRGINILLLSLQASKMGYTQNIWGTFKAWQSKGGKIIKGSKATRITFYKSFITKNKETGEEEKFFILKAFNVFNIAQVDGVEIKENDDVTINKHMIRDLQIDSFVANTKVVLKSGGNRAFYSPKGDFVAMPELGQFKTTDAYYATLLHELTHWTGNKERCERNMSGRFGNQAYAFEELVAELGSMFLCADLKVLGRDEDHMSNHIAYLDSWIKVLRDDKRAIFKASTLAQQSFDYLQDLQVA